MRLIILILGMIIMSSSWGIECSRARTAAEQAICSDPALLAYDKFLSEAYESVRAATTPEVFAEVRKSQRRWLKARDERCQADPKCMIVMTQQRTAELNAFAQRELGERQTGRESPGRRPRTEPEPRSEPQAQSQPRPQAQPQPPSPSARKALSAEEIYRRASRSVVVVHAFLEGKSRVSQGSGVVLARDTVATNCHVIKGARHAAVLFRGERYEVVGVSGDKKFDYCVVTTTNLPAEPVPMGRISSVSPGQRVFSIGSPRGLELTIAEGLVSGLRPQKSLPLPLIQTSAPISRGSSGGGLFNEQGQVIGITTMQLRESQNLNFALPVELINHIPRQ